MNGSGEEWTPSSFGPPTIEEQAHYDTLPNLIVIGAMKCGTTALHRYLDQHPDVAMSEPKELNFFSEPTGNWRRGVGWYAARFRPAPVRGEASPGYTSPSFPEAAERMARVVPETKLVYAVRDPVERAVSQYLHHRADGTERRPIEEALLDPESQYLARSRYYERLEPYLARFPRERIFILAQEDLLSDRRATLRGLYRFAGVDDSFWSSEHELRWNVSRGESPISLGGPLRRRLVALLSDDAARLRELTGLEFTGW
ncbi:MAG: sulfotransferase [Actinomycetota bacterium]|nr:sulfotransferase [Actinomycetota bacterium]